VTTGTESMYNVGKADESETLAESTAKAKE
jgi:hypothetical protein